MLSLGLSLWSSTILGRGGVVVPANAIRDRANSPILDRAGGYIEVRA